MRKIAFLLVFWFSSLYVVQAQVASYGFNSGDPAEVGMLNHRLEMASDLIDRYVDEGKLPGGVFIAARYGQIVFQKTAGDRSEKDSAPYRLDDIFRIASMTKAVTTVAVLQLYEDGLLGIDDPVHQYLPEFKDQKVLVSFNDTDSTYATEAVVRPVTIRHLLTHTSGISYGEFNPGSTMAIYQKFDLLNRGLNHPSESSAEFVSRLAAAPLMYQPGEQYAYGLNMDVLGRIVEVVSKKNLQAYFKSRIFEPLGMVDTWFYLPSDRHDRLVPVYTVNQSGEFLQASFDGVTGSDMNYALNPEHDFYAGGGGLVSTAYDYARFLQALLNNGMLNGERILGRKAIEMMTSDQMILLNRLGKGMSQRQGESMGFGLALVLEDGQAIGSKSTGTYEWAGYFNTRFFVDPNEGFIFVGMTQVAPFPNGGFWNRLYALLYSAIEEY